MRFECCPSWYDREHGFEITTSSFLVEMGGVGGVRVARWCHARDAVVFIGLDA